MIENKGTDLSQKIYKKQKQTIESKKNQENQRDRDKKINSFDFKKDRYNLEKNCSVFDNVLVN